MTKDEAKFWRAVALSAALLFGIIGVAHGSIPLLGVVLAQLALAGVCHKVVKS